MASWSAAALILAVVLTAGRVRADPGGALDEVPDLGPPAGLQVQIPAWRSSLPVKDYPLHRSTLAVLEEVRRRPLEVRVQAFYRELESGWVESGRDERMRVAMGRLLEAVAERLPSLSLERHDSRSPLARQRMVRENGVYILEAGGRRIDILASDLEYLYTVPGPSRTGPSPVERVAMFRGEEAIASALRELLEGRPSTVCFTTGSGEGDPKSEDAGGFGKISDALERSGFEVDRWEPGSSPTAPEDCRVVAMVGPRQELAEPSLAWLTHHLRSQRPFVLLLDAGAPATGLQSVLGDYALELTDNHLIEPHPAFRSPTDPRVSLPDLNGHFITTPLMGRRQMVGLRDVRGIRYGDEAQVVADVRTILQSSGRAWGETRRGPAPRRHQEDLWPPVSAAVAVSSRLGANDALEFKQPGELRLAVVGDASFASNAGLARGEGNQDFFLRLVRWVARETPRVPVPPIPVHQILR